MKVGSGISLGWGEDVAVCKGPGLGPGSKLMERGQFLGDRGVMPSLFCAGAGGGPRLRRETDSCLQGALGLRRDGSFIHSFTE